MDETDTTITFDENGVCNHCTHHMQQKVQRDELYSNETLSFVLEKIRHSKRKSKYHALIGLSGGTDSSYVAHLAKEWGLEVLLVHVDGGWNSEVAVHNIEKIIDYTGFDFFSVIVNWKEMKDLQLSFFKASVMNCDIPQDHAFVAGVYQVAKQFGIQYILNGYNFATESVLPKSWGHRFNDLTHLEDIHRRFGHVPLKTYPKQTFFDINFYDRCFKNIKSIPVLNFINYDKEHAQQIMHAKFFWETYSNKHGESIFTKFFQTYYLPVKFGVDKRKAHLSSLILSRQMTREAAIEILQTPTYNAKIIHLEIGYIAKKLGISMDEFMAILNAPAQNHNVYKTNTWLVQLKVKLDKFFPCLDFSRLRY